MVGDEQTSEAFEEALSAFNAATREEALIDVPGFVFWEIAMLLKIGRVSLQESYGDWSEHLVAQAGFDIAPFLLKSRPMRTPTPLPSRLTP